MPAHIFCVDEINYQICLDRGLAAIPGFFRDDVNDGLLSRMALINKGDYIIFYIMKNKELKGMFQAKEKPFYDETPIWPDNENHQLYPYRVRFDITDYVFPKPINLSDIYDLKDQGLIWTFTLTRPTGKGNALFSITNNECDEIIKLFLKVNPFYSHATPISHPHIYCKPGFSHKLNFNEKGKPKYESTLMFCILEGIAEFRFDDIFGPYQDYVAYVPTTFNKEIDVLLIHENPFAKSEIINYTIIEVKNGQLDEKGLSQILKYEDWFIKKKANGDMTMIRSVVIASSFSKKVIDYLAKRKEYENKEMLLLKYDFDNQVLNLLPHSIT